MICVHKLKGEDLWVNPDLIAFVEAAHGSRDTVLTLADGNVVVIADTPEAVAESIRLYRATVLALAFRLDEAEVVPQATRHLQPVPDAED